MSRLESVHSEAIVPSLRYSGVTEGGQLPPGAAGKGAQNSLAKNILLL